MEKQLFLLYNSGILEGSVDLSKGIYRQLNIEDETWEDAKPLQEPCGAPHLFDIPFDVISIYKHFQDYSQLFYSKDKGTIVAPWGAEYNKEGNWLYIRKEKRGIDILFDNGLPVAFVTTWLYATTALVKEGYEDAAGINDWSKAPISDSNHHIMSLGKHMVPMRDGIRLATFVWIPSDLKEGQKIPTILVRTPYNALRAYVFSAKYVRRGYALVLQDLRGRETSEGVYIGLKGEINDGDDTLNWIAAQSWSDGKVGTIGGSYCGFVQWSMAASGNPHLGCMVSFVTAAPPFKDIPRRGGTVACGALPWAYAMTKGTVGATFHDDMERSDWSDIFAIRPLKDLPEKAFGFKMDTWNAWIENETDNEYWAESDWSKDPQKIKAPALIESGWFDDDAAGSQVAWDIVKHYPYENRFLMLGPWLHKSNTTRDSHALSLPNNALIHNLDIYWQRWFDFHLKGMKDAEFTEPHVKYYMLGSGEWRNSTSFPPEGFEKKKLFFGPQNALVENVKNDISYSYKYDPANPAPHIFDPSENELAVPGDYTAVEKRQDVVCFSYVFEHETEIVGDFLVSFYASSSALDTDFVVRATYVDLDGKSTRMAGAVLRAKFRNGCDHIDLLQPGKIEKYELRLTPIARHFYVGEQLRIHITSSAKDLIVLNYNTGLPVKDEEEMVVADQVIYCGPNYPSNVLTYFKNL